MGTKVRGNERYVMRAHQQWLQRLCAGNKAIHSFFPNWFSMNTRLFFRNALNYKTSKILQLYFCIVDSKRDIHKGVM